MNSLQVIASFLLFECTLIFQKQVTFFFFKIFPANPIRARLFHHTSLVDKDVYEPFLRSAYIWKFSVCFNIYSQYKIAFEFLFRLLWKGNWFIQEKSCKILALIVRYFKHDTLESEIQIHFYKYKFLVAVLKRCLDCSMLI